MFDFGEALNQLRGGLKVARKYWHGPDRFLYYVPEGIYPVRTEAAKSYFGNEDVPYDPYIAMKTYDGSVTPWTPSQTDMLAEDWALVE